jgi:hypothetical protein
MPPWLVRFSPIFGAFLTGALAAAQQSLSSPGPINWYMVAAWTLVGGVLSAFGIHLPAPAQAQLVNDLLALVERLSNRQPVVVPAPAPIAPPTPTVTVSAPAPASGAVVTATVAEQPAVTVVTPQPASEPTPAAPQGGA